jgi:hypothetical protein
MFCLLFLFNHQKEKGEITVKREKSETATAKDRNAPS